MRKPAPKTDEQIDAELAKLKALKPSLLVFTSFGDDTQEAIDAQCYVLRARMSRDDLYDTYGDESAEEFSQYLLDEALAALNWMSGERNALAPSDGWSGLAS